MNGVTKVSPKKRILCSLCRKYKKTTRKFGSYKNNIDNDKGESYLTFRRNDIPVLMEKFERLTNTNIELEKSVNFCCEKLYDYGRKMDNLFGKTKLLEEKINGMDSKYMNLEM